MARLNSPLSLAISQPKVAHSVWTAHTHHAHKCEETNDRTVYHLHVDPVPSNGDCQGTLAHLDPFIRGEATPCVAERPETCQVGDLAGKYGPMTDTIYNASFTDPFVSLREDMGAFFGNRSFVLHYANTSRIACGNFSTLSESRRPGAGVGTNPNVLLNSSMSTTTTSVLDNLFATVAPTNGSGPLNNLLTTTSTSLFFANATAFVTPSAVGTGGPLQVTASSATSVRTSLGLVLVSSLIGLVAFS